MAETNQRGKEEDNVDRRFGAVDKHGCQWEEIQKSTPALINHTAKAIEVNAEIWMDGFIYLSLNKK